MKSIGQVMQELIERVFVVVGNCPDCGADLYQWRQKLSNGEDRCGPTCMVCGYKALKKKQDYETKRLYQESLKKRALNYFKFSSLVPDKTLFDKHLSNYAVVDQETKRALEIAKRSVNEMLLNKPIHVVLTGKSGVGKSHLAMGIAWDVLERSHYQKNILFVNYRELLEQIRFSYNNDEAWKQIQEALMPELKVADLVILDDVGAELSGNKAESTDVSRHNNDTLYGILEARQNMATVITTNLTGKEIRKAYGERILSRIMRNSSGFEIVLATTKDKRVSRGSVA